MNKNESSVNVVLTTFAVGIIIVVAAVVFQALEAPPIYYKILILLLVADGIAGTIFLLEYIFKIFSR